MAKKALKNVIVRSADAGVFAGELASLDTATKTAVLKNARRLWYWDGAATLSELAQNGVKKPQNCKFPQPVDNVTVLGVCEMIDMTPTAVMSVAAVPVWSA